MSFWDNVKKFAQPYGDDEYEDEYEEEGVEEGFEEEEAPQERPARRRPSIFGGSANDESNSAPAASTSTGFSGQVVSMGSKQEVVLFRPANFGETTKAADALRSNKAVVLNLENVDKAMSRRVVDFLSGCAYALDGKVKKIAQSTYLFCPHNMDVVGDLETMQAESDSFI